MILENYAFVPVGEMEPELGAVWLRTSIEQVRILHVYPECVSTRRRPDRTNKPIGGRTLLPSSAAGAEWHTLVALSGVAPSQRL